MRPQEWDDYVLTGDDALEGRKREDGVAKGCHHIDIHQDGTGQIRIPIANGGSYDIPYPTLLPRGIANMFVVGRCFSSTRIAHSSARVMGTCLAMGQAAGTAAAMASSANAWGGDLRAIDVTRLRDMLRSQGAILEGTA